MKDNVKLDIFLKSDDINVYKMFADLSFYHNRAIDLTNFEPYYITSSFGFDSSNPKATPNCYFSGKYCSNPNNLLGVTSGREIINENLRQKCIWTVTYKAKTTRVQYWNYMNLFFSLCIDIEKPKFDQDCSYDAMTWVGIDQKAVKECVTNSFNFTGINSNSSDNIYLVDNNLIKKDKSVYENYSILFIPTVLINNRTFMVQL